MEVTRIRPSPRLAPFVDQFTIIESREEATRVLLPERGLLLGIRYAGAATQLDGARAIRLAHSTLTGILGTVRHMRTHAGGGIIVAHFRTTGAAAFFRAPLFEIFGATVELEGLWPRADVARLAERIALARDHAGRAACLEAFLLARLQPDPPDPFVAAAVRALEASHGSVRIAQLARTLGISQDPLEKRFRRAVGASPKQLASLIRVHHAIEIGRRGASWSQVAHQAGYFDQSHFNREFRAVAGAPPTVFFRSEHC
jgi:methylphosphotriester-DNA--protein-cysteine methyltransferase